MNMYELIKKKRDGGELSRDELAWIVEGAARRTLPEVQLAAWLMACFLRGLSPRETVDLTLLMAESGEQIDLSRIPGCKVDKHSTGGVGDKLTLIVAPLVAAAGLPVAKLSGRALGHTGGTLDKLESIPGLRTELSVEEFVAQVERIGVAIASAGPQLAPADKVFYALRDQTATVDHVALIAASVISKKLAAGADAFVLDVKVGSGAFLKELDQAVALARTMVQTAEGAGRKAVALVTDMNQPLGNAAGNAVEVAEAVAVLSGNGPQSVRHLALELGSEMLVLGGLADSHEKARQDLVRILDSGRALESFRALVAAQGGDPRVADQPEQVLPRARWRLPVMAMADGYVQAINGEEVGLCLVAIGAGRAGATESVDHAAGVLVEAHIGDRVEAGKTPVAWVQGNDRGRLEAVVPRLAAAWTITPDTPAIPPLVYERVA
ncbi:MAG: thymidine phosphorylase [Limnochordales bacterium]|nr:thymidine phosphorylase [Limnochordales bacterium]